MTNLPFAKVEGVGNGFVLIDALGLPELDWPALAVRMCAQHFGVGADGLLVLLPSQNGDFKLRMFNPDGTEDACGNGLRCAVVYVHSAGLSGKSEIVFEARDGLRRAEMIESGCVRVNMGCPSLRAADIPADLGVDEVADYPLEVGGGVYHITAVSVGTPHAVICAPPASFWETIPPVSRSIETHHAFPERISVTWCLCESPDSLRIHTWERGVGRTLGCGTGACAALVAAHLEGLAGSRARVSSPGGTLEIEWPDREDIFMSGPASIVYRGIWTGEQ